MPLSPHQTDPRFWVLSEALSSYASDADDPPIEEGDHLQAAVSLVVRAKPDLELLFIKRARSERDPWSGQMALPGGRRDDDDAGLIETAMREAMEEVGLDLKDGGRALGRLDEVSPNTPLLPKLTITPFVFGIDAESRARIASHEVARIYWIPIDELRDPANISTVEVPLPNGRKSFPCYCVAGEIVWGLTYRMVSQFMEAYPKLELDRLRS